MALHCPVADYKIGLAYEVLLFRGVIRRRRRFGPSRRHIDVLAGFGISKLLAGFFFDRRLIGLEALNLLGVAIIVTLHFDNLLPQGFIFSALLLVDDHPVGPEHN